MTHGPQRARFDDGRMHFQHGPIDLLIGADGARDAVALAHDDAWKRFQTVLAELVTELGDLRRPVTPRSGFRGPVASRMLRACGPLADRFITPMAAVAGAVADELIAFYRRPGISRAYVNNGGDIALHLEPGTSFRIGVYADLGKAARKPWKALALDGAFTVGGEQPIRGIATSGWRGRSFSLGIADSVTVLAASAAAADAAATLIANEVDVADPRILRAPANTLKDDTDLGALPVTVEVPRLERELVSAALERGAAYARELLDRSLIHGAVLFCQAQARSLLAEREAIGHPRIESALARTACPEGVPA